MYDIMKKYIDDWSLSSSRTYTEIQNTTTLKIFDYEMGIKVILENCSKKFNMYQTKTFDRIIENLEDILDFVIHF
jgi:hypothetical protein